MIKAYKYRLLPTEEQQKTFELYFNCVRFIYNLALETKMRAWESGKKNLSAYDLMRQVTELKNTDCQWLKSCNAQSLQSAISHMDVAYKNFFRGGGFPKFKKKGNKSTIHFKQWVKVVDNTVIIGKIGSVRFVKHRAVGDGIIKNVVVSKTTTGNFFVSILINDGKNLPDKKPIDDAQTVGIDVGLMKFATLSDGETIENPRFLQKQIKRLRIAQRTLDRRYKKGVKIKDQSKGWHKQRLVVARIHESIQNKRKDFLHKSSTSIINKYESICVENLNISGMQVNRRLSKSISDVSWFEFFEMLKYKAQWEGKNVIEIGMFEPSSKTCSGCGEINKELSLSDRNWVCEKCGIEHDRDVNAAKNIKNMGLNQVLILKQVL